MTRETCETPLIVYLIKVAVIPRLKSSLRIRIDQLRLLHLNLKKALCLEVQTIIIDLSYEPIFDVSFAIFVHVSLNALGADQSVPKSILTFCLKVMECFQI